MQENPNHRGKDHGEGQQDQRQPREISKRGDTASSVASASCRLRTSTLMPHLLPNCCQYATRGTYATISHRAWWDLDLQSAQDLDLG